MIGVQDAAPVPTFLGVGDNGERRTENKGWRWVLPVRPVPPLAAKRHSVGTTRTVTRLFSALAHRPLPAGYGGTTPRNPF